LFVTDPEKQKINRHPRKLCQWILVTEYLKFGKSIGTSKQQFNMRVWWRRWKGGCILGWLL